MRANFPRHEKTTQYPEYRPEGVAERATKLNGNDHYEAVSSVPRCGLTHACNTVRATIPSPASPKKPKSPIEHVKVLASDAMMGRGSPSPGLSAAAEYIISELEAFAKTSGAAGIEGANPDHPSSPFLQAFRSIRFAPHRLHGREPGSEGPLPFHSLLFERGFFTEGLSQADKTLLQSRIRQALGKEPDLEQLKQLADSPSATDQAALASMLGAGDSIPVDTNHNVVAFIEGSDPALKDEVILLSAHYDHVGERWGEIYNGADDNASGTAAVLTAMQALAIKARRGELKRSVAVVFTAAEELGLLGAAYFARNPVAKAPLSKVEGYINVDMVGRLDGARMSFCARTQGAQNHFVQVIDEANRGLSVPFTDVRQDINAYERRQDGWIFNREGVDGVFLFEGLDERGQINPDYHQPSDDTHKINEGKLERMAELVVKATTVAANR